MSDTREVLLAGALADVSELFITLATTLRATPGIRTVASPVFLRREERSGPDSFRVGTGAGFRFEWYADADLEDGRSLTFSQELSWHGDSWTLEVTATATDGSGNQQDLWEHSLHVDDLDELCRQAVQQAARLLDMHADIVQQLKG